MLLNYHSRNLLWFIRFAFEGLVDFEDIKYGLMFVVRFSFSFAKDFDGKVFRFYSVLG